MSDTPKDTPKGKSPGKKPNKRLAAAIERREARAPANDPPREEPREELREEPRAPQPPPIDTRPIAPLWDLPEQDVRIPVAALNYTVVFRYVLSEETGKHERVHCGQLPPDATGSAIRERWGGGRYFLQARCGQRLVASRELSIDGPESSRLPFGPIGELPSGLVTLQQGDSTSAAVFAMFQMWMAAQRQDFQAMLAMQQSITEKLASQYGANLVATHLRDQLASANARVSSLEKLLDEQREKERENDREAIKRKYKGDKVDWVEVVEAVGEIAPNVLNALPPRVKGFLEGLIVDGGKALPSGVTEHPLGG